MAREAADTAAKGGLGAALLFLAQKLADKWRPSGGGLGRRVERLEERLEERMEKALANHAMKLELLLERQTRTETKTERLESAVDRLEGEARQ